MTKAEKNQIIKWVNTLTNEELEKEYYDAAWNTLGSEAEEMYERGWEMQDILEREKYEKWLGEKCDLLEMLCEERGIKLWNDSEGLNVAKDIFVEPICLTMTSEEVNEVIERCRRRVVEESGSTDL
jgi:hypothetical protein